MKIELHEITIKKIVEGYTDNNEEGVIGYNGNLNIRPKYQREFVYDNKMRDAVIDTIKKGFPLNVMYWVKNEDGTFEVLDGQQRTISFCQYVSGDKNPMSLKSIAKRNNCSLDEAKKLIPFYGKKRNKFIGQRASETHKEKIRTEKEKNKQECIRQDNLNYEYIITNIKTEKIYKAKNLYQWCRLNNLSYSILIRRSKIKENLNRYKLKEWGIIRQNIN